MVVGQGAYTGIIIIATFLLFAFFGGKAFVEHAITENKKQKDVQEQQNAEYDGQKDADNNK